MLGKIRVAIVVVLIAGLVVAGYVGYRLFTEKTDRDPPSSRVTGTTDDGWQQVSYRGVTVELPPDWQRLDTAICDAELERWATVGVEQCDGDTGLSFLDSRHVRCGHRARRAHDPGLGHAARRWLDRLRHPG